MENLQPIYDGSYSVSKDGFVFSHKRKGFIKLKSHTDKNGYQIVTLIINTERLVRKVHRLVAEAYLPNTSNLPQIDHINKIKDDNRIENLRWVSAKDNVNFALAKKVGQYTKTGELVRVWDSIFDAKRIGGFCRESVGKCCNCKHKTHRGFIWKFI